MTALPISVFARLYVFNCKINVMILHNCKTVIVIKFFAFELI